MESELLSRAIGSKIEMLRKKRKFSQERLSQLIDVSRSSIVNIEKGRHTPSLHLVYRLAIALRVEISELLPTLLEAKNGSETVKIDFSGLNEEQKNSVVQLLKKFEKSDNEKKVAGN